MATALGRERGGIAGRLQPSERIIGRRYSQSQEALDTMEGATVFLDEGVLGGR